MGIKFLAFLLVLTLSAVFIGADRPARCLEPHPVGEGSCYMISMGYYYNPTSEECEQWLEDGCEVKGGNTYESMAECEEECVSVD